MLYPVGVPTVFSTSSSQANLSVGMSVYDCTGNSPVLISGPTLMSNPVGNAYVAKFTPPYVGTFLVFIAVYTDNTLTVLDPNYQEQTDDVTAVSFGFNVPTASIIGLVIPNESVEGVVNC